MSFILTKATGEEHFELIEKNAEIIWNEHYGKILEKEQIDYMLDKFQSKPAMKNQISNNGYEYYLIENDGNCGYLAIKKEEEKLFLSKLYLLKEARGKGISRKVFSFIKDYAIKNNLKSIYLTVNKNNFSSIEVYKHFGFEIIREEKADIGNGFFMDDYIMEFCV